MTHLQANVAEFKAQLGALPGDRMEIASVGPYILELYYDPLGAQDIMAKVEVNEVSATEDGEAEYQKWATITYSGEDTDIEHEEEALAAFRTLKRSPESVEESVKMRGEVADWYSGRHS